MNLIVNKVAESGLFTLNLEQFLPQPEMLLALDIAPFLFKGMILREKDFRAALLEHDWSQYQGKHVAIYCSADAIIPMWAYMLIAVYLRQVDAQGYCCKPEQLSEIVMLKNIEAYDLSAHTDARVVLKGCGQVPLPESAYLKMSERLLPVVKSLMYGEPCSTVPIYKRR
ncbi:MAG TPA: DUF2480 family protein [Edaphocola sp.]|nr:DUF2480 family protein [Edaphocola sp.]